MTAPATAVTARDNPLLVRVRKLVRDGGRYRKHGGERGAVWLEGEHLCQACVQRGWPVAQALVSASGWADPRLQALARHAVRQAVVADALFAGLSSLDSPPPIGFLLDLPADAAVRAGVPTVVLDRLQDPGNAGSILRSAAALGAAQVVALAGTVSLWSPKVLRAGMGAHFALHLLEGAAPETLDALALPLIGTSSHAAPLLADAPLPVPCAWVFGHEGQGIDPALAARCVQLRRIPQPGGEESLNVAAAAAICLYESLRQRGA